MIYLEDPQGALRYDALPEYEPPEPLTGTTTEGSSWIPQEEDDEHDYDGMEQLFKLGTPDHYLTLPQPRLPTPMPSSSAAVVPTTEVVSASSTDDMPSEMPSEGPSSASEMPSISTSGIPQGDNTTMPSQSPNVTYDSSTNPTTPSYATVNTTANTTANTTVNTTTSNTTNINTTSATTSINNSSSNIEQNNTASENNDTMADNSTQQHDNNHANSSSIFDRALEAYAFSAPQNHEPTTTNTPTELFAPSTQPSTSPHPTKTPSVIHEITGEYTHIFDNEPYEGYYLHDYQPFGYFYDQKLLRNPNDKYVMYDLKQARFGVDLGPRGEAHFVNLVLPPRWWDDDDGGEDSWWDDEDLVDKEEKEEEEEGYGVDVFVDGGGVDENASGLNGDIIVSGLEGDALTNSPDPKYENGGVGEGGDDDAALDSYIDGQIMNETFPDNDDGNIIVSSMPSNMPSPSRKPRRVLRRLQASDEELLELDVVDSLNMTSNKTESEGNGTTLVVFAEGVDDEGLQNNVTIATNGTVNDLLSGIQNNRTSANETGIEGNNNTGLEGSVVTTNVAEENQTIMANGTNNDILLGADDILTSNKTGFEGSNNTVAVENVQNTTTAYNNGTIDSNVDENVASPEETSQQQQQPPVPQLFDSHHIADYFCWEDFLNWRLQVRNASRSSDDSTAAAAAYFADVVTENPTSAPSAAPSSASSPSFARTPNEEDLEETAQSSTPQPPPRPLTILVKRGRCSFESKAKMAMVLNNLLQDSGRSNRIAHLVVYNNGTAPVAPAAAAAAVEEGGNATIVVEGNEGVAPTDNNATMENTNNTTTEDTLEEEEQHEDEEKLIDMSRVSHPEDSRLGPVTVGLVYITTDSGKDILRRMGERMLETGTSPYLDLSMLFAEDDARDESADDTDDASRGTPIRKKRILRGQRRALSPVDWLYVDGSTKDGGVHGGTVIVQEGSNDEGGRHDAQVTRGWFFPATLTKFCQSCGPKMQYGFYPNPNPDDDATGGATSDGGSSSGLGGGIFSPGGGNPIMPLDPPVQGGGKGRGGRYYTEYYSKPWLDAVRKMMIAILILLLAGPVLLAARRWYTVGGTLRVTMDENGSRRIRVVGPNLEVFVNGIPGTVETNGTKLDRAQVFSLPEVEYVGGGDGDGETAGAEEGNQHGDVTDLFAMADQEGVTTPKPLRDSIHNIDYFHDTNAYTTNQSALSSSSLSPIPITPSPERLYSVGSGNSNHNRRAYVSSTTCSICIDEFVPGELVRVLPRCNHAFHTECILPWLTERQGCCPMCKVPVLPEELQRGRGRRARSTRENSDDSGSSRSSLRHHRGGRNGRRFRRSSVHRGLEGGGSSSRGRNYQSLSTQSMADDAAPSTERSSEDWASAGTGISQNNSENDNIASGVRLVSEIESDLDAAIADPLPPRVVTPDGPPRTAAVASSTLVPLGAEGGVGDTDDERNEEGSVPSFHDLDYVDLMVMEQSQNQSPSIFEEEADSTDEHNVRETDIVENVRQEVPLSESPDTERST